MVDVSPTLINAVGSKQVTRFLLNCRRLHNEDDNDTPGRFWLGFPNWKRTETVLDMQGWISLEKRYFYAIN